MGVGMITLKAHVMEHHICNFNDEHGMGDKDNSFIELHHQKGASDERWMMACIVNYMHKHKAIASHANISSKYKVGDKILEVNTRSNENFMEQLHLESR